MPTEHPSLRERIEDAVIVNAPVPLLQFMARFGARPVLGRKPGWFFDASEEDPSRKARFRRKVWREFQRRRLSAPVHVRWYSHSRLRLFLGNDLSKCIYVGRAFEPNEFAFLEEYLRDGMTFIDVGANEGVYTVFAARRVGPTGRTIAIEPSAREYGRLQANVRLNHLTNVHLLQAAAGAADGVTRLAIAEYGHEGQNTVGARVANAKVATSAHEEVALVKLDTLLESLVVDRVDLIKIDTEGSEAAVLAGARRTIARFRPVLQFEVAEEALASQRTTPEELLELVRSFGYSIWVFDAETGSLRAREPSDELRGNVVASPTDRQLDRIRPG